MTEVKEKEVTQICLCMLTKNSSKYIVKTLDSIIKNPIIGHRIGYCVIVVDSSTSDDCEEIIKSYFNQVKVPLKMKRAKWQSYSYNRNLALDLCDSDDNPCEYTWMNDDDDYLVGEPIIPDKLNRDTYQLRLGLTMTNTYWRPQIIKRSNKRIRYTRRVHEYLENTHYSMERIQGKYYINAVVSPGGKEKQLRYIALLNQDLQEMPGDTRSIFYIAESYFSMEDWTNALEKYQERSKLGGYEDEIYLSHMNSAFCHMQLKHDWGLALAEYLKAHEVSPQRHECIARIANNYSLQGKWNLAYRFAQWGLTLNPNHGAFLQDIVQYDYVLQDVLALTSINLRKFHEAIDPIVACLYKNSIPPDQRPRLLGYMKIAAKETFDSATSVLGPEDIQRWLNDTAGPKRAIGIELDNNKSAVRSLLRCSYFLDDCTFHLRLKEMPAGLSDFESITLLSLSNEVKGKSDYKIKIPNGLYCARIWHPSQYIRMMESLQTSVLIISDKLDDADLIYDMELEMCYYVGELSKSELLKYSRIEKGKIDKDKVEVCYLPCPIFIPLK